MSKNDPPSPEAQAEQALRFRAQALIAADLAFVAAIKARVEEEEVPLQWKKRHKKRAT